MHRRLFFRALICGVAALAVVAVPVLADELFGTIKSVDIEGKKLKVTEKDTDKEIEVTVTPETTYETKKGSSKIDLEKISKNLEKSKGKGIRVEITHEKGVASKIKAAGRPKAE